MVNSKYLIDFHKILKIKYKDFQQQLLCLQDEYKDFEKLNFYFINFIDFFNSTISFNKYFIDLCNELKLTFKIKNINKDFFLKNEKNNINLIINIINEELKIEKNCTCFYLSFNYNFEPFKNNIFNRIISNKKNIDGFSISNFGNFFIENKLNYDYFTTIPTELKIIDFILNKIDFQFLNKKITIVSGNSFLTKLFAIYFEKKNNFSTNILTIVDYRNENLKNILKISDIIILTKKETNLTYDFLKNKNNLNAFIFDFSGLKPENVKIIDKINFKINLKNNQNIIFDPNFLNIIRCFMLVDNLLEIYFLKSFNQINF